MGDVHGTEGVAEEKGEAMKYAEIVEALKAELGLNHIRSVLMIDTARGRPCEVCGRVIVRSLQVRGSRGGGRTGPVRLVCLNVCPDRALCRRVEKARIDETRDRVEEAFVPAPATEGVAEEERKEK